MPFLALLPFAHCVLVCKNVVCIFVGCAGGNRIAAGDWQICNAAHQGTFCGVHENPRQADSICGAYKKVTNRYKYMRSRSRPGRTTLDTRKLYKIFSTEYTFRRLGHSFDLKFGYLKSSRFGGSEDYLATHLTFPPLRNKS